MRLERNGGISILPKKNLNLTLSNLIPVGASNGDRCRDREYKWYQGKDTEGDTGE